MIFLVAMACKIAPQLWCLFRSPPPGNHPLGCNLPGQVWSAWVPAPPASPPSFGERPSGPPGWQLTLSKLSIRKTLVKIKMTGELLTARHRYFSFMLTSFLLDHSHLSGGRVVMSARRLHDYTHWSISSLRCLPQFLQAQYRAQFIQKFCPSTPESFASLKADCSLFQLD